MRDVETERIFYVSFSVDDAVCMGDGQRICDLKANLQGCLKRKERSPFVKRLQSSRKALSSQELHR